MAIMKNRNLKVIAQSGYKYRETPTITLKGQWLKDLGFEIGDYVSVSCENGTVSWLSRRMPKEQNWLKQSRLLWTEK